MDSASESRKIERVIGERIVEGTREMILAGVTNHLRCRVISADYTIKRNTRVFLSGSFVRFQTVAVRRLSLSARVSGFLVERS